MCGALRGRVRRYPCRQKKLRVLYKTIFSMCILITRFPAYVFFFSRNELIFLVVFYCRVFCFHVFPLVRKIRGVECTFRYRVKSFFIFIFLETYAYFIFIYNFFSLNKIYFIRESFKLNILIQFVLSHIGQLLKYVFKLYSKRH